MTSRTARSKQTWALWALLTVSGVLQLALVASLGNSVSGGDAHTYLKLTQDWRSLDTLLSPTAFEGNFWPAGYPGFLALFSAFGDQAVLVTRVAQVVLVLSMAVMAGRLAACVSLRARDVTTAVVAFSPTLIWATWAIGYELLLGWLMLASTVLIYERPNASRTHRLVASGAFMGLALIVQFRAVSVLPILVYLAWRGGRRAAAVWVCALAVPVGVWIMRSFVAHGTPVPWSANGGYNLWNGNGPHATGHNVWPLPDPEGGTSEYSRAALQWILSHPSEFFDLLARKTVFLFYPTEFAGVATRIPAEGVLTALQWVYTVAVVSLLMLYIGSQVWGGPLPLTRLRPVLLISLLYLLPNIIFIVEARFRIPVEALLLTIVTPTALALWDRRRDAHLGNPLPSGEECTHESQEADAKRNI